MLEINLDLSPKQEKLEGFVYGMDDKEYRQSEGLCSSDLKTLVSDPFCYFHKIQKEPTPSMVEGTLLHLLFCEPHKLNEKFFIHNAPRLTQDLKEEANGRPIVKEADLLRLQDCVGFIKEDLINQVGLDLDKMDGEVSFFGEFQGIKSKCRADKLTKDKKACFDIKKTKSASHKGFTKQCCDLHYGIQEVFYREVMGLETFIWLAVETAPLVDSFGKHFFRYGLFKTSDALIEQSRKLIDLALQVIERQEDFLSPLPVSEFIQDDLSNGFQKVKTINPPLWYLH